MKKYIFIEHNGNMISTYTQFTFQDLTLPFNAKIIFFTLPRILNIQLIKHILNLLTVQYTDIESENEPLSDVCPNIRQQRTET